MIYLFDFDGTLVDSMPVWANVQKKVLLDAGITPSEDFVKIITPLGSHGTAEYCGKIVGKTAEEVLEITDAALYKKYAEEIPAKDNVKETLIKLKEQGHSLNVLTACPHGRLDVCLKRLGLFDLFENVWSSDDFGSPKSEPQIYKDAAKRLGVLVSDCTFLDDNLNAVSAAKKAGMISFGVYDESSDEFTDQIKNVADGYIYNFKELL